MYLRLLFVSAFAVALLVATVSSVSAKDSDEILRASPANFAAQRAEIEKGFRGDEYSELTRTQREDVIAALDRMEDTLAGVESIDSLETKKKVQLLNDQELINTVLTQAKEDSRLICRNEVRTGSHRLTPQCRTVGERRRQREEDQANLRKMQRSPLEQRE
jgi:hypothetical protein